MKKNKGLALILKPFQWLYAAYAMIIFVALMVLVFLWSLLVLPLGRIRSGNLIYYGCMAWADLWFFFTAIRHRNIYEGLHDPNQSYIYVANHISYLDSAIIPKTFRRPVRPLGKVEMTKIPIFGFIYKNVIVTVDRSSVNNRAKSLQTLRSIIGKGISVLVFPEGTFNTTHKPLKEFYDGAFRLAIETGTPIKPVLLLHSYSRMHYNSIFTLNPGKNRCVFLEEITINGLTLSDLPELKQRVFQKMEEALVRYGAEWAVDKVEGPKSKIENRK